MANKVISNEGLSIEIKNLASQITDLKASFIVFSANYVTKDVYELRHDEIRKDMMSLQKDIIRLQNRKALHNWLFPLLGTAFGALFTFLLLEFFNTRIT
jgi:uncharacterized protein with PhoU and TrkA domain